jgi:hypothetical protein
VVHLYFILICQNISKIILDIYISFNGVIVST